MSEPPTCWGWRMCGCTDAGIELLRRERLDDVVVGPGVERLHYLGFLVSGRGHDDRHGAHRSDHAQQLPPVHIGEPQVEHHYVGRVLDGPLEPGHAGSHRVDLVAPFGQCPGHRLTDSVVVFDEEDRLHGLHDTVVAGSWWPGMGVLSGRLTRL